MTKSVDWRRTSERVGGSSRRRIYLRVKDPVCESRGRGTFGSAIAIYTDIMFP
jgi:hypothetical protein